MRVRVSFLFVFISRGTFIVVREKAFRLGDARSQPFIEGTIKSAKNLVEIK